ncbi:AAA family ATPase [Rhizobium rosettiformans]|uniref:AAA family ATPase n=1 Tax=Rhizobium rosettiformans TaxID=1368430 RepID=UPI00285CB95A|nr:AAA family ATPase [Rhizobium rosettiformans]MDR7027074.1 ABC-type cobalamin/Fe3+-siderophores transport system ATPase subunit [Rhizobium rosettiformans]MDR7065195.1 ABC-type cobalamin/Fe3+-siderophores transport system ATPase subunit [Rhizobium rosettiformans]
MSFELTVPLSGGESLNFTAALGEVIFVLGANGTGKSSLLQRLYAAHHGRARRISAHRQTWFQSNAMTMSAHDKKNTESSISSADTSPQSRWMDNYSAARASVAIYDLIDAENVRARGIADAVDADNLDLARQLSKHEAPIRVINELLKLSNIPIEIIVRESEQVMASRNGGPQYSIAELSDGERNALLIAASVLTAKPGTILFIDEPERHLHRSIISPLLTILFSRRADCAFVVSTHDVMLPLDNRDARTLLVRGCTYQNSHVTAWDADLLSPDSEIDEQLKQDVLGSRRKLLFVEGTEQSLDKPLYSLLFPQVSVIAKASCRDVEHSVASIRDAHNLHWLHAFGIVDNDRRPATNIAELKAKGVYAVPVYAVESLYYHTEVMQRLAVRQQTLTGVDADTALEQARVAAIAAIKPHIQRLSERVVEASIRQDLMSKLPKRADIAQAEVLAITIDISSVVAAEVARLTEACDAANLQEVIARYPVRETPALDRIATNLGFQGKSQYESAVRKLLMDDSAALSAMQNLFNTLKDDIDAS